LEKTQNIISFHAGYLALDEILKRIPGYLNPQDNKASKNKKDIVQWTAPKDAKNDFVQLVYGLHLAGFINNGKGEITKITESLADTFEIELGKNWQSNHSASIHKANKDYIPPIFDKIKEAYLKYSKNLQQEKDKK
ncbi:MAG: RteC domain-containing protein, partial [Bacteroidia bacterium]